MAKTEQPRHGKIYPPRMGLYNLLSLEATGPQSLGINARHPEAENNWDEGKKGFLPACLVPGQGD